MVAPCAKVLVIGSVPSLERMKNAWPTFCLSQTGNIEDKIASQHTTKTNCARDAELIVGVACVCRSAGSGDVDVEIRVIIQRYRAGVKNARARAWRHRPATVHSDSPADCSCTAERSRIINCHRGTGGGGAVDNESAGVHS